uniref:Neurofilament medium polypeptide n=1 Tax=Malurus cyaneus samueli TaxID=2593467 RepID=A0A8C5X850_9PASS
MSYTMEPLGNPSYRRVTETRATYSRASASPSSGFRSQSWSRGSGSTVSSSYKRPNLGGPRAAYGSTVLSSAESLDVSQSSLLNGAAELKLSRSNEKEQLQGLNDRFAGYIEKVHYLEQQNKEIEAELAALRQKHAGRAQLSDAYEQELRELRGALEQVSHEKAQIQLDSEHIEEDIQRLRERFEDEARLRDETEATIRALRKEMEEASLMRAELDKKVQSLQDEVAFLRGNHEEEVAELLAQLQASHATVERKDYLKTDLTTALKEIRAQLECQSDHNMHQAEEWFKCRYAKLTEAAEQNKEAIRSAKEEIAEYRRQLQSKSIELESVRGTKESLERQLSDIEERHNNDLSTYQVAGKGRSPSSVEGVHLEPACISPPLFPILHEKSKNTVRHPHAFCSCLWLNLLHRPSSWKSFGIFFFFFSYGSVYSLSLISFTTACEGLSPLSWWTPASPRSSPRAPPPSG